MSTQTSILKHTETDTQALGTTSTGNPLETQNIHATGTIGTELDLNTLNTDLESSEDYSDKRGFILIEYDTIDGSIHLWRTGSYAITGIDTMAALKTLETRFLNELQDLGISLDNTEHTEISNYVATLTLNSTDRLNLSAVSIGLGLEHVEYEPGRFAGLLYRPESIDGVCLIFGSGSILITGVESPEAVHDIAEHIQNRLVELALI